MKSQGGARERLRLSAQKKSAPGFTWEAGRGEIPEVVESGDQSQLSPPPPL